jgi:hypothetical protein
MYHYFLLVLQFRRAFFSMCPWCEACVQSCRHGGTSTDDDAARRKAKEMEENKKLVQSEPSGNHNEGGNPSAASLTRGDSNKGGLKRKLSRLSLSLRQLSKTSMLLEPVTQMTGTSASDDGGSGGTSDGKEDVSHNEANASNASSGLMSRGD